MFRTQKYFANLLFVFFIALNICTQPALANDSGATRANKKETVVKVATFDSGFGGFFTAKEIEKQADLLSGQGYGPFDIAHYGDTARAPYGEKTPEQIAQFTSQTILSAFNDGYKDVYIACNTASTQYPRIKELVGEVRPEYANHIYSIIDVSVKEVMKTVSEKLKTHDVVTVAVLATPATVKSENYPRFLAKALNAPFKPGEFTKITQPRWLKTKDDTIDSYSYVNEINLGAKKKVVIYQFAPANWVDMIEHGASDKEKLEAINNDVKLLTNEAKPNAVFDVVGEFCTHYPVFDSMIQNQMKTLGKTTADAPFIVQGPLMGNLFKEQFLKKHPLKASQPVTPPTTPHIYLSGTNIESTQNLVKKIFPNDPAPIIERKSFADPQ